MTRLMPSAKSKIRRAPQPAERSNGGDLPPRDAVVREAEGRAADLGEESGLLESIGKADGRVIVASVVVAFVLGVLAGMVATIWELGVVHQ